MGQAVFHDCTCHEHTRENDLNLVQQDKEDSTACLRTTYDCGDIEEHQNPSKSKCRKLMNRNPIGDISFIDSFPDNIRSLIHN